MGAENSPGLKLATDAAGHNEFRFIVAIGERSLLIEARPEGLVDGTEVILPARVAIKRVRTPLAVSLRFPEEGQSAQG